MKDQFIKAIMSALRLENNIFIQGAIELLINRLAVEDYQAFIAYLGERKANYEKPIESIAKGVDEFCSIKEIPKVNYAEEMSLKIREILINVRRLFSDTEKFNDFLNSNIDDEIFKNIINSDTKEKIFNDEILEICFGVGLHKIAFQLDKHFVKYKPNGFEMSYEINIKESHVYKYLTKDLSKSITEKISHKKEDKFMSLEDLKSKANQISKKNEQK